MIDLDEIERLAHAALEDSNGPWTAGDWIGGAINDADGHSIVTGGMGGEVDWRHSGKPPEDNGSTRLQAFLAKLDPLTVLELVELARRAPASKVAVDAAMRPHERHVEAERDGEGAVPWTYFHEWSVDTENGGEDAHPRRLFVRLIGSSIGIIDAAVTSKNPGARELCSDTDTIPLTEDQVEWLLQVLPLALATKRAP